MEKEIYTIKLKLKKLINEEIDYILLSKKIGKRKEYIFDIGHKCLEYNLLDENLNFALFSNIKSEKLIKKIKIIFKKFIRIETDFIGSKFLKNNKLYGIHTVRANENFNIRYKKVNESIIRNIALIKYAAAKSNCESKKLNEKIAEAIMYGALKIYDGFYLDQFILPGLQGGAGTSINMNVNEVIANIALNYIGENNGNYEVINPIDHVNLSQSTNDVVPTAVKMAAILKIQKLVEELMNLQMSLQDKEKEFAHVLKLGRTQLKDAIPITLGQEFSAYAESISRDRWRLYKCEERLRVVNIGGTAIGTGVGANLQYRYQIIEKLQNLTGIGLARSQNLIDTTQNLDVFVEVSGLLKTLAVNLSKISNDLRLMDSGPESGLNEIILEPIQAGSSIMPKKVNPVGPEFIKQIYYKVVGNDLSITMAAGDGEFELNAFLPIISDLLLENVEILTDGVKMLNEKVIKTMKANVEKCKQNLENSTSLATLFLDKLSYTKITEIIKIAQETGENINEIIKKRIEKD